MWCDFHTEQAPNGASGTLATLNAGYSKAPREGEDLRVKFMVCMILALFIDFIELAICIIFEDQYIVDARAVT